MNRRRWYHEKSDTNRSQQLSEIEDYYTVDKSAMIAEFLERKNNGNSDYTAKTFW